MENVVTTSSCWIEQLNVLCKSFFFDPWAGFPHPSPTLCGFYNTLLPCILLRPANEVAGR